MNEVQDIEQEYLVRIQRGEQATFEKIFRKYYASLCSYATAVLGNDEQSEDVVQEVFIYFWNHREKLEVKLSLRAYLYTSVRHQALKIMQKRLMEQKHGSRLTEFVEYLLSTDYTLEEERAIARIREVMEKLPQQCLKVFLMSCLEGRKYAEIADELGISVNTVKAHVMKAYRIIREKVKGDLKLILFLLGAG